MCNRIEAFELWTNVKQFSKITNQEVLRQVQLKKECLLVDIRKKKVCHFGHNTRNSTHQHALLEGKIEDRRSRGRPRTMWMGNMTEWSGYGYVEATRKAQDRNYWRQLIASDPAIDGTQRRRFGHAGKQAYPKQFADFTQNPYELSFLIFSSLVVDAFFMFS